MIAIYKCYIFDYLEYLSKEYLNNITNIIRWKKEKD